MRFIQPVIDWADESFIQPWATRFRSWFTDHKGLVRDLTMGVAIIVGFALLFLIALLLLWIDQWWSAGWLSDLVDRITGRLG